MQIAICDDEVSMVQILEKKIKKLLPDAVIDKYLSGDELIASGSKPDILFLDIQMPGMDGMETAKVLRQDNEDMILIFVTAAEAYVFQAFDLSVILNNALDNCMENVSGENPYISLSSFRKNSIFMITIKNRYEGELNYKDSDLPETTKSGKEHGIGLHNIRRVARMYMGDISLEQENQEVVLSIMLQVE